MKFIYWTFYVFSFNGVVSERNTSGVISVTDSTMTTYVYDQYVTWNIVEKQEYQDRWRTDRILSGVYYLERNHINSYCIVDSKSVYQYIATDPPIRINMKRKDEYKNRR